MDQQERLYALALSLVPDVDVAGDIFMDARDEADLIRRANRWRRQQGLPDFAAPGVLPQLSAEQSEYAAHLALRGRRRRRVLPFSGVAGVAFAALLVIFVGFRGQVAGRNGLAADPTFSAQPVATSEGGGLQLVVYKTEATPGSVTVWWAIQGPNAAQEAAGVDLALGRNHQPAHATRVSQETASSREDRLVGRTAFRTPVPFTASATVSAFRGGSVPDWQVSLVIEPQPDPGARTVAVDGSVLALSGQVRVTVESITLADDYTVIYYRPEGEDFGVALANQLEVVADGTPVVRYGSWNTSGDSDQRAALYGPLPEGVARLELTFPRLAELAGDQTAIAVSLR